MNRIMEVPHGVVREQRRRCRHHGRSRLVGIRAENSLTGFRANEESASFFTERFRSA